MKDSMIARLDAKGKRYTINFGEGLYLRINPTGHKSWVFRYCIAGISHDITLGTWPELKTVNAKQALRQKQKELELNPSIGATFNDAYQLWKRKKKGYIVSYESECRRIEQYLLPLLRRVPLDELNAPMALGVLTKIDDKLPTVRRLCMRLNEIMELAVCAGLINQNPCRRIARVFAKHTSVNRPFIPAERLGELFALCREQPIWYHCFVLWAVYCMLRPVECVSVKFKWIEEDTLTLPAEIMKKRRVHRVPICPAVVAMLGIIRKMRTHRSEYIWCFTHSHHISKQMLSKNINKSELNGKLCHHGLRATARTWMKEQGVPFEIAEDCLAHVNGNQTERAYLRGDYLEQRRPIYAKWWSFIWGKYCASCADDPVGVQLIERLGKLSGQ